MRVVFLGCGYLGHNLSRLLSDRFCTEVWGIPSPYTDVTENFTLVNAFDPEDLGRMDLEDAVVVDSTGLVANNAVSSDEEAMLADLKGKYTSLLSVLKEKGVRRFVYISSGGTIYGSGEKPFAEDDPVHPVTLYARSKDLTEKVVRESGVPWLIIRLANPFGGYQEPNKKQGVIPILARKALHQEVFQMWTDGSSVRDYIYITDTAKAVGLLIEKEITNEVVNIGSGIGTSLKDVVSEVEKNTGKKILVAYQKLDMPVIDMFVLDITKLKNLTGFEPEVSFAEGVRSEVERVKKELGL